MAQNLLVRIKIHIKSSLYMLIDTSIDDFEARSLDELSLVKGERIELIERDDDFGDGWYLGKHLKSGKTGLFPEGKYPRKFWNIKGLLMMGINSLHNYHP